MDDDQVDDKDLEHVIGYVLKRNRRLIQNLGARRDRDEMDLVAKKVVEHFRLCGYRVTAQPRSGHSTSAVIGNCEPSEKSG